MTDKEKLGRVIDAIGSCYHQEVRELAAFPNDFPTKARLSGMTSIIMHSGLNWIKEDQRWNKKAEKDARQAGSMKTFKGAFGADKGNE